MKQFIKGFKKGFRNFGENFTAIINSVLLSIVYFIGVGPVAVLSKIFRKRYLELKTDKNAKSYWKELNLKKKPMDSYYRQF